MHSRGPSIALEGYSFKENPHSRTGLPFRKTPLQQKDCLNVVSTGLGACPFLSQKKSPTSFQRSSKRENRILLKRFFSIIPTRSSVFLSTKKCGQPLKRFLSSSVFPPSWTSRRCSPISFSP